MKVVGGIGWSAIRYLNGNDDEVKEFLGNKKNIDRVFQHSKLENGDYIVISLELPDGLYVYNPKDYVAKYVNELRESKLTPFEIETQRVIAQYDEFVKVAGTPLIKYLRTYLSDDDGTGQPYATIVGIGPSQIREYRQLPNEIPNIHQILIGWSICRNEDYATSNKSEDNDIFSKKIGRAFALDRALKPCIDRIPSSPWDSKSANGAILEGIGEMYIRIRKYYRIY